MNIEIEGFLLNSGFQTIKFCTTRESNRKYDLICYQNQKNIILLFIDPPNCRLPLTSRLHGAKLGRSKWSIEGVLTLKDYIVILQRVP